MVTKISHDLTRNKVLLYNPLDRVVVKRAIPNAFGVDYHHRPEVTGVKAAGLYNQNPIMVKQLFCLDLLAEPIRKLVGAQPCAAWPATEQHMVAMIGNLGPAGGIMRPVCWWISIDGGIRYGLIHQGAH